MKSFLQGKKTLTIPGLRAPTAITPPSNAVSCSTSRSANHAHATPGGNAPGASSATVEVVKEGDKVVRLVITCTCGERVEVECIYPAGM